MTIARAPTPSIPPSPGGITASRLASAGPSSSGEGRHRPKAMDREPDPGTGRRWLLRRRRRGSPSWTTTSMSCSALIPTHCRAAWSDEEVVRRWGGRLFPPRDRARNPLEVSPRPGSTTDSSTRNGPATAAAVAEPGLVHEVPQGALARMVNREEGDSGERSSRGGSKAWRSSTTRPCWPLARYIDLNPVAAGIAAPLPGGVGAYLDPAAPRACRGARSGRDAAGGRGGQRGGGRGVDGAGGGALALPHRGSPGPGLGPRGDD